MDLTLPVVTTAAAAIARRRAGAVVAPAFTRLCTARGQSRQTRAIRNVAPRKRSNSPDCVRADGTAASTAVCARAVYLVCSRCCLAVVQSAGSR